MLIYKATNKINGKIYIGQTTKSLEERKKRHKQDSKRIDTYFYRAIQKYGWENFSWEVVQDNIQSIDELDRLEQYYIAYYNCFDNPSVGYNTQSGGHHFKLTQEECEKRRQRVMGKNNPMYGKPGTWLGKHFSEEHKQHISEALSGKPRPAVSGDKNPSAKKIINLDTKEIFGCIKDAVKKYNISTNSLSRHLNGKTKTCCGCTWEFYDINKNYDSIQRNTKKYRNPKKQIYILELNKICKTATEAAKIIGCSNSLVSKRCKQISEEQFVKVKNYHIRYIN